VVLLLGNVLRFRGDYTGAIDHYEEAAARFDELGSSHRAELSRGSIGFAYQSIGDGPRALAYLEPMLKWAVEQGDRESEGQAISAIGSVHMLQSDYVRALECYHRSLSIAQERGHRIGYAIDLANIGNVYHEVGDYRLALEHYESALAIHDETGNRDGVAIATGNIGSVHFSLGALDRAEHYYRRTILLWRELGNPASEAIWLGNLGIVLQYLGDIDAALAEYRTAIDLAQEHGMTGTACMSIGNMGNAYRLLGDVTAAQSHYERALAMAEELGDRRLMADWIGNMALLVAAPSAGQPDLERACELSLRALELASEIRDRSHALTLHRQLSELFARRERWKEAYDHTVSGNELERELERLETHKAAQNFEHRRQIAEIEKRTEVELAEARAAETVQRMKSEQTEQELANSTLQLLAMNELLRDLRNDLLKIARKIPPSEPAARELRERLKRLPCESVDWEKYDHQFRSVHPEFVRSLTDRAPDLTPTELRICTMLRMNLKSHEIAALICTTERGVEFHRVNIRQKLKLRKEEKLPIVLGAM